MTYGGLRIVTPLFCLAVAGCGNAETVREQAATAALPGTHDAGAPPAFVKPRIITTTDLGADPDDKQSLVRLFVMANDYDIEGLIVSTGCWRKKQQTTGMLDRIIDAYDSAFRNLTVHDAEFPDPDYFRSIAAMGQLGYGMDDVGAGKTSRGAQMIIDAVDKDDPRPVWALCWGGCNTIAQALYDVRNTRTPAEVAAFVSKLRIYDVLGQDDAGTWIADTFPELLYIRARGQVYSWQPSDEWLAENVQSHGPLGGVYPDRKYATEGDTPAFLHMYANGLNDPDRIEQGGWGGRFAANKQTGIRGMQCMEGEDEAYDPYLMYSDAPEGGDATARWKTAIENDFEARMDWSVAGRYDAANHHPIAVLNSDRSRAVKVLSAAAGETLVFDAAGSSDPDGDAIAYGWSVYDAPTTYAGTVSIDGAESRQAAITIPADAKGSEIHLLLEVKDDGEPSLTAYRRAVLRVSP